VTGPAPRTPDEELLLARVSEAAGRARVGRRLASYPGVLPSTWPRAAQRLAARKGWRLGVAVAGVVVAVVCRVNGAVPAAVASAVTAGVAVGSLVPALFDQRSRRAARPDRLDLYQHGLTVVADGRIHVVRYDTTSVLRMTTTYAYTLTDVDGEPVVLHGVPERGTGRSGGGGEFRDVQDWGPVIQRALAEHLRRPP
jgi:hypothetical protein